MCIDSESDRYYKNERNEKIIVEVHSSGSISSESMSINSDNVMQDDKYYSLGMMMGDAVLHNKMANSQEFSNSLGCS